MPSRRQGQNPSNTPPNHHHHPCESSASLLLTGMFLFADSDTLWIAWISLFLKHFQPFGLCLFSNLTLLLGQYCWANNFVKCWEQPTHYFSPGEVLPIGKKKILETDLESNKLPADFRDSNKRLSNLSKDMLTVKWEFWCLIIRPVQYIITKNYNHQLKLKVFCSILCSLPC